jgi:hypothetical protein
MKTIILLVLNCILLNMHAQQVPSAAESLDFLITSSVGCKTEVGDDDHEQTFFFLLPKNYSNSFYIRVYDPETSGKLDEKIGMFSSETTYTIYSGAGTHSDSSSRSVDVVKNHKGRQMDSKTFGSETTYDQKWMTFGPYNPKEGEFSEAFNGYVFKLCIKGSKGDDVNLYRLAMSSNKDENIDIPQGNVFTYEYAVRLKSEKASVAHFYPYIDNKAVTITQFNFDFDGDGEFKIFSGSKNGEIAVGSGDNVWAKSKHKILDAERGKSLDIQLKKKAAFHNDFSIYLRNQYNEAVPFFAIPLGGVPNYKYKIKVNK